MRLQKRLAANVLGCSEKRVLFDRNKLDEIKEAITKADIKNLINQGSIIELQKRGISRSRANKRKIQKSKGLRRGHGSRKGKAGARGEDSKTRWVNKIRLQRRFISALKNSNRIDKQTYKDLYKKSKGGFFRSKGHIIVYLEAKGRFKGTK